MKSRLASTTTVDGYRLTIAGKRPRFLTAFGYLWLFAWWVGSVSAFVAMSGDPDGPPIWSMPVIAVLWLAFSGPYSYLMLWTIAGKEIITIGNGSMTIKRDVLGVGPTQRFAVAEMQNLRAIGLFGSPYGWSGMLSFYGLRGGVVAFESAGKTIRFGVHLEEDEAREVVRCLEAHLH